MTQEYRGQAAIDVGVESTPRPELTVELERELEFLRYFYGNVDGALGPASDDIYALYRDAYVDGGGVLPKDYEPGTYGEEDNTDA